MAIILVIEDEPTIRTLICEIFAGAHTCHALRTAEEGLALLAETAFDVVITDVKLPGMDGEEFLRAAHAMLSALPIIVISGGYGYGEERFVEAGAFGYLLKPFRAEDLEALVARALATKPPR